MGRKFTGVLRPPPSFGSTICLFNALPSALNSIRTGCALGGPRPPLLRGLSSSSGADAMSWGHGAGGGQSGRRRTACTDSPTSWAGTAPRPAPARAGALSRHLPPPERLFTVHFEGGSGGDETIGMLDGRLMPVCEVDAPEGSLPNTLEQFVAVRAEGRGASNGVRLDSLR